MKSLHCRRLRLPQCQLEVWMIWIWFRYMEYPHISIWNPYGIHTNKWYSRFDMIYQASYMNMLYYDILLLHSHKGFWLLSRSCVDLFFLFVEAGYHFIELDDGKIYRKTLYLMVKTMVSCRFSLKPIQWPWGCLMMNQEPFDTGRTQPCTDPHRH